jgi:hypothetical protein
VLASSRESLRVLAPTPFRREVSPRLQDLNYHCPCESVEGNTQHEHCAKNYQRGYPETQLLGAPQLIVKITSRTHGFSFEPVATHTIRQKYQRLDGASTPGRLKWSRIANTIAAWVTLSTAG